MRTIVLNISAQSPEVISATAGYVATFNLSVVAAGPAGPQGPIGPAGIIVSSTEPVDPIEGQLWLQISP